MLTTVEKFTCVTNGRVQLVKEGYSPTITVGQYAMTWIQLNTYDMAAKYKESVLNAINNHILPIIGGETLSAVKPDDARLVMANLAGKSSSLQSKVLGSMRAIFEAALCNGLIEKNPCDGLKAGGKKTRRKDALTTEQTNTLLAAVEGSRAEVFIRLALYAGLRREEALALKWDCVVLHTKCPYIIVRRALRWEHNRPIVGEELKTDAAERMIPIPNQLACFLAERREEAGYVIGGDTPLTETAWKNLWHYVTARQTGEKTYWLQTKEGKKRVTHYRELGAKCKGANFHYSIDFDVTPHQLRHTYCTNLILSGANVKRVQYLMGHRDSRTTMDIYAHVVGTTPEIMMEEVVKAFGTA